MDAIPVLLIKNRVCDWSQSCSLASQPEEEVAALQKSESCILLTSERVVQMGNWAVAMSFPTVIMTLLWVFST